MKPSPSEPTAFPPRGAAVEVVVPEPRRAPLILGAGLLGLGVALGSALGGRPAQPLVPLGAALGRPVVQVPPPPPIESAITQALDVAPPLTGQEQTAAAAAPTLQVLFAVDTTGSMGGVLRAAREKVWTIADALLRTPGLRLELGLVAFRDAGDEYTTRVWAPSADLDGFYAALQSLAARGGGDEPEALDLALEAALRARTDWLAAPAGRQVARAIVLVGDAPPHPAQRERTLALTREAAQREIAVHTVYCGQDEGTAGLFARLAAQGGGVPARLDLHPQVVALSTPHDAALAELQRALEATALPWGSQEQQAELQRKQGLNSSLGAEAWTSRASAQCKNRGGYREDLLQALEEGRVAAGAGQLPRAGLPAELAGLPEQDLQAELARRMAVRRALRERIAATVAARDAWLSEARDCAQDPLTRTVVRALLRQLEADGLLGGPGVAIEYGC